MITLNNDDILILMKWNLNNEIHGEDVVESNNLDSIIKNILLMRSTSNPQEVHFDSAASNLLLDEECLSDATFELLASAPNITMEFFEYKNEHNWVNRIKSGTYTEKQHERLMRLEGFELSLELMGDNIFTHEQEEEQLAKYASELWNKYLINDVSGYDVACYIERYTNGVRSLPSNLKYLLKAGPGYHSDVNSGRLLEEDMNIVREIMALR